MARWTKNEDDYLKENYGKEGNSELAKKLNRTIPSIQSRSRRLNIKRSTSVVKKSKMKKVKYDLTNKRFGKLTAIKIVKINNKSWWECVCDCGKIINRTSSSLMHKTNTKGCGCVDDLSGNRYGKLSCLRISKKVGKKRPTWECVCDCGKNTEVSTNNLTSGHTKSCGCLRIIVNSQPEYEKRSDVLNKTFNRLTIISEYGYKDGNNLLYLCTCECGETTLSTAFSLINNRIKSCGCYKKENMSGKNSPLYNHNLTDEERIKRRDIPGTIEWRISIFTRDNRTCQVCNQKRKNINAHHLDGWNWCKEKRFDINNGVTLCECCHKDFHSNYGYGNNTKEQFEEYKENLLVKN